MAREAGFDLCGIAPAEAFPELEHFDEWLAAGYAGEMRYLERSAVRRADVRNVVPAARSVFDRPTLVDLWRRSDADTQARLADSAMSAREVERVSTQRGGRAGQHPNRRGPCGAGSAA